MSVKQIKWHSAVLALTIVTVLAALFALATVTSHADEMVGPVEDEQGNLIYIMSGSTYDGQINLEDSKTTIINISGDNTLTNANPFTIGDGNLTIIGNGTLKIPKGSIICNDFTMNDGAKLIVGGNPGMIIDGSVDVSDAAIDVQNGQLACGSVDNNTHKNVFNNASLRATQMPGLSLNNDSVLTNCNVTIERAWMGGGAENITIDGGTYNVDQAASMPALYFYSRKVIVKNASIKTSSFCFVQDLEMTDSSFEVDGTQQATGGPDSYYAPALYGDNVIISGCKINIDCAASFAGIDMYKNLIIKDNTEMDIKGLFYGLYGDNIQIIHSSGKIQATDHTSANAAIGAIKTNDNGTTSPGTISLNAVSLKEPAGGIIGTVSVPQPNNPNGPKITIAAILDGNTPAKSVVLEAVHTWDAGKVTKQPTASSQGVKTYTCTVCGATKTEAIGNGEDGTPFGKGASVEAAEAALFALPDDNDPAGTAFGLLQLKASKVTKNSIKLNWKAVPGAAKYMLYANRCGKGNKYKKLGVVTGTSCNVTQVAGAALKKGTYYKFIMIAADSNGRVVSTSKTVHAATKGGKVGNHKKVTVKKSVIKKAKKLKKGKTLKLKAKAVPQAKKLKVRKHRGIKYESSNPAVAQVNGKGTVKGVGKGTCYVYAYAQNGTCAKVKVTVK